MAELFDVTLCSEDRPMPRDELVAAMRICDVLVPTVTDDLTGDFLRLPDPSVRLIANYGMGVDHINLAAARDAGIIVSNTPGVFTDDTADMTMALVLSVSRRLAEGDKMVRAHDWRG